jgi:LysM repeat protein
MPGANDDRQPTSWTARVLAPIVLVVVAAALVLVISGSLSGDDSSTNDEKQQTTNTSCPGGDEGAVKDGYYVVQEGDNFTSIAEQTCVPEDRLQELNPNLDPFGLQVQNCVDLVPDGCKALSAG